MLIRLVKSLVLQDALEPERIGLIQAIGIHPIDGYWLTGSNSMRPG